MRGVADELDVGLCRFVGDAVEPAELSLDLTAKPVVQLDVAGLQVRLHVPMPPLSYGGWLLTVAPAKPGAQRRSQIAVWRSPDAAGTAIG